jgi:hypothetical protein
MRDKRRKAESPNTPPEDLSQLARDQDVEVRWRVARNINTPDCVLVYLAKDFYWYTRLKVANNPKTSTETILRLMQDEDEDVKAAALRRV